MAITGVDGVCATSDNATDGCLLLRYRAPVQEAAQPPDNIRYKVNIVANATI